MQSMQALFQSQQQFSIQDLSQKSIDIVIFEVISSFSSRKVDQKVLNVAIKSKVNPKFLHKIKSIKKTSKDRDIITRKKNKKTKFEKTIYINN